ncbi:MAG: hypothetical protein MZU84_00870 [Sphingobacterium sp.]|nr:hypothetical protein [Sphingobacterium sp.]
MPRRVACRPQQGPPPWPAHAAGEAVSAAPGAGRSRGCSAPVGSPEPGAARCGSSPLSASDQSFKGAARTRRQRRRAPSTAAPGCARGRPEPFRSTVSVVTDQCRLTVCLNPVLQRSARVPGAPYRRGEPHRGAPRRRLGQGDQRRAGVARSSARATALTTAGGAADCFLDLTQRDGLTVERVDSSARSAGAPPWSIAERAPPRSFIESAPPVSAGTEAAVRSAFARLLPHHHGDALGHQGARLLRRALRRSRPRARAANRRLIVDLAGPTSPRCLAERPDVAKPNYEKFLATFLPARAEGALDDPETEAAVRGSRRGSRGRRARFWC